MHHEMDMGHGGMDHGGHSGHGGMDHGDMDMGHCNMNVSIPYPRYFVDDIVSNTIVMAVRCSLHGRLKTSASSSRNGE